MNREWNNQLLQRAAAQGGGMNARFGQISAYDPDAYAIKAIIQPEGIETGFIPFGSPWVGSEWGAFFGPEIGAQVLVIFQEGSAQVPIGATTIFSTAMPPVAVPSGELLLQHKSGSLMHFGNDGNVVVTADADMTLNAKNATVNADEAVTVNAPSGATVNGDTQINGNLMVSGDISDSGGAHGSVATLRDAHNVHDHDVDGVQGGSSTVISNAPNTTV